MRTFLIFSFSAILFLSAYQPDPLQASKLRGKKVYELNCQTCHSEDGQGAEGVFPPLAKADYLMQNRARSIRQVLHGARGTMVVNGKTYTGEMPAQGGLSDADIADVLNYVRNSWGNQDTQMMTAQEVRAQRR
jgi:mono/diheme cytochrome c family protein